MPQLSHPSGRRCILAIILTATGMAALPAIAAKPAAPPRPVASSSIVIEPGETREARARHGRERTNVVRNKRDHTRDDSPPGKGSPPKQPKPPKPAK